MAEHLSQIVGSDSSGKVVMKRVLTRWDLVLYGLVILTPTAPYPIYGLIQQVSGGHAAVSYVVAMVAMLFTAISYARMTAAYPSAGSTYTFVQRTFSPLVGFLAGWAMLLDYLLIPLESIIYAALTAVRLLPAVPYFLWVLLFTALITLVNVRGIRLMTRANTIMMAVMTFCALTFIVLALWRVIASQGATSLLFPGELLQPGALALRPVMLGAAIATLSYIGFDAISTLAEDTVNPKRDVGYATILVCILQTGVCVVTVYLASLVWPDYRSFSDAETAILDVGRLVGGPAMFGLLTFVLLVAGIASALTGQAGASRLLYAMGRDGVISRSLFSHLHPRYATPTRAVCVISFVSLAGALGLRFQIAVELLNFGAFAGFVLVNLSVIQHYYVREKQRRGTAVLNNLIFPLLGASVCASVWMSLTTKAKVVGTLWLLAGAVYLMITTRGVQKDLTLNFDEVK